MPSLTIKNLPPVVYERLKESAERNRRSLNSEVIVMLEKFLPRTDEESDAILHDLRRFRKSLKIHLTDKDLRAAKRQGRA